ncbi:UvrB/UvrC motif-containing protein [Candidatus Latescibacterota bacterium]
MLKICSDCAKKKGISIEIEKSSKPKINSFIGSLTSDLADKDDKDIPDLTCDVCGLTFAEFKKDGLFGCDQCHIFFGEHISTLLKQIHGTDTHEGKLKKVLSKEGVEIKSLRKLRSDLKKSIEIEDYEKAAVLRDKIAELQEKKAKK